MIACRPMAQSQTVPKVQGFGCYKSFKYMVCLVESCWIPESLSVHNVRLCGFGTKPSLNLPRIGTPTWDVPPTPCTVGSALHSTSGLENQMWERTSRHVYISSSNQTWQLRLPCKWRLQLGKSSIQSINDVFCIARFDYRRLILLECGFAVLSVSRNSLTKTWEHH